MCKPDILRNITVISCYNTVEQKIVIEPPFWGMMIERCLGMKIIGTQKELDWIREALANNCDGCVFGEKCSENACREQEQHGKVLMSCREFLDRQIRFVLADSGSAEN